MVSGLERSGRLLVTNTAPEREPRFRLSKDHEDLLSELNAHGVEYLLVGGYVVGAYSEPRSTKDLDVSFCAAKKTAELYISLWLSSEPQIAGLTPADFRDPKSCYQIGIPPERVDILKVLSGLTFEEAWQNRVYGLVNGSVQVPVISYEDLVKNKVAAARPRDLLDVEEINRGRELLKRFYPDMGNACGPARV